MSGEEHPVTRIASRHHTVHHIHSQGNILQYINRGSYSHEVARLILGEYITDNLSNLIHLLSGLSYRKSPDSIAISPLRSYILSGDFAQIWIYRTLNDRKQRLIISVLRSILSQIGNTTV